MAQKKYLDYPGLSAYDELIKDYISEHEAEGSQSDWAENDSSKQSYIKNKPTLGTVADKNIASTIDTSNDIPTANQVKTFVENKGYITDYTETDPTVPSWAKQSTKPSYTASEVGLGNVGNFKAVSTVASQGLTDTEKSNARANIGAGTSSFSGSYNDLSNKPTIPAAANNGTLTIQKNGTNVQTFTANQSTNATANITVPTKVSELTNDSGYTTNTGTVTQVKVGSTSYNPSSGVVSLPAYPTSLPASDVYAWAKASTKPSYTASEIGAATSGHTHTTSIATSTGTNQLTLAFGTKYALTAGGTSYIFTMPSNPNTDTKVTQTATSTNSNYEVLFSATADNTTRTEGARKYSNFLFNPSTGNLQVTQLNGVTIGSSPKFTDTNTWTKVSTTADGYITKLPGDTSKYFRGDGSWATLTAIAEVISSTEPSGQSVNSYWMQPY